MIAVYILFYHHVYLALFRVTGAFHQFIKKQDFVMRRFKWVGLKPTPTFEGGIINERNNY